MHRGFASFHGARGRLGAVSLWPRAVRWDFFAASTRPTAFNNLAVIDYSDDDDSHAVASRSRSARLLSRPARRDVKKTAWPRSAPLARLLRHSACFRLMRPSAAVAKRCAFQRRRIAASRSWNLADAAPFFRRAAPRRHARQKRRGSISQTAVTLSRSRAALRAPSSWGSKAQIRKDIRARVCASLR